jgi:hypothetical protein
MTTLRCKQSFTAFTPTGPLSVAAGALLDSTHDLVKGREALFTPVEDFVEHVGRTNKDGHHDGVLMERATAEPGERRSVRPKIDPEEKPVETKQPAKPPVARKGKQDGEV